jgi:hypothetical protein
LNISVEEYLENFRKTRSEEAYREEVKRLAAQALKTGKPEHELFWKELTKDFDWFDWDAFKEMLQSIPEPATAETDPERIMVDLLKRQMPGIKTQAQYDAVVGAMDVLRLLLNAVLEQDWTKEMEAMEALKLAIDATRKATELTDKLEEVPEASDSEAAEKFKQPPAQFQEQEVQAHLLEELAVIQRLETLNSWYAETRERRDQIVTQSLRDTLLDKIRKKKHDLT